VKLKLKEATDDLGRARDTADERWYDRADAILNGLLAKDPGNAEALSVKAWALSGRHRFTEALALARKASALRPFDTTNYGIMVDCLVELGRYDEAVAAAQKMVDLKPTVGAFTRIAYLRWWYGDPQGYDEMMQKAVDAGKPGATDNAWCLVQAGNGFLNEGHVAEAEQYYRQALAASPGYMHALAAMGRVRAVRGDFRGSASWYEQAVAKEPSLGNLEGLGDAYRDVGNKAAAEKTYSRFLHTANQQLARPETALQLGSFLIEHDRDTAKGLSLVMSDANRSQDIPAWDAAAWALYRNGRDKEAGAAMAKALRLGTKDARLFYRAGVIQGALGDTDKARTYLDEALSTNPYFEPNGARKVRAAMADVRGEEQRAEAVRIGGPIAVLAALGVAGYAWAERRRRTDRRASQGTRAPAPTVSQGDTPH
jgi:pentatricopeptide repeat protein